TGAEQRPCELVRCAEPPDQNDREQADGRRERDTVRWVGQLEREDDRHTGREQDGPRATKGEGQEPGDPNSCREQERSKGTCHALVAARVEDVIAEAVVV